MDRSDLSRAPATVGTCRDQTLLVPVRGVHPLFLEEIPDALDLVRHAEDYRRDYNTVRPHEALAWNRPHDVHAGAADPLVPNFPEPENLPTA